LLGEWGSLTQEAMKKALATFSYKPHCGLEVHSSKLKQCFIFELVTHTTNCRDFNINFYIYHRERLDFKKLEQFSLQGFYEWLRDFIISFEVHEAKEWMTFNGSRVFDPHKEAR
jgi:hypothetical protein